MVKICSNCSSTLDNDAVFCASCRTPIVKTIHCPKCDKTINADAKFCKYCAFDLCEPIQNPVTSTSPSPPFVSQNPQISTLPPQVEPITLPRTNLSSAQIEIATDNPVSLISPAGAAFAVICFFLPWLEQSCGEKRLIRTGAEIANSDSILWLLPIMGIISFAAYFICKRQKALFKARPFIIGSSAFALCFFLYKFYSLLSEAKYFDPQNPSAAQIKSGTFGIVIGFVLAIVGCFFMSRAIVTVEENDTSEKRQEF
jgi:hypothetical protein